MIFQINMCLAPKNLREFVPTFVEKKKRNIYACCGFFIQSTFDLLNKLF